MRIRNFFHSGSGMRDGKIWIQDKHPGSATLLAVMAFPAHLAQVWYQISNIT
jgi:hypothetical protein